MAVRGNGAHNKAAAAAALASHFVTFTKKALGF